MVDIGTWFVTLLAQYGPVRPGELLHELASAVAHQDGQQERPPPLQLVDLDPVHLRDSQAEQRARFDEGTDLSHVDDDCHCRAIPGTAAVAPAPAPSVTTEARYCLSNEATTSAGLASGRRWRARRR